MKLPVRRLVWLIVACAGALALLMAQSTIDENNIIHDSALMPLGAILLLAAPFVVVYDVVKTLWRK
ncbi:hypothetical protein AB1E22_19040 [Buttiauxella gaviniae]|uniref:DUF3927 domain-containing protein n=1 Tax=Buttiauxella gaviniae TaxID=82990 RepID=A0ABV3NZ01_9ENTR